MTWQIRTGAPHYLWISTSAFNVPSRTQKAFLFATQFAQITLVITFCATFEDLLPKGFVQPDATFAGHLLGKFSALASITNILPQLLLTLYFIVV